MTRVSTTNRRFAARLSLCRTVARLLLGATVFVLVVMPFTEALFAIDNYPRGGEDLELSVFVLLALLCMAVLALFLHRGIAKDLLSEPLSEPHEFTTAALAGATSVARPGTVWNPPRSFRALGAFAIPRRI